MMLLAILFFTLMDATAKGLVAKYPVPQVIWLRFAGQVVVVAVLLRFHLLAALRTEHPWLHLVRSTTQLATAGCFFWSLSYIGLAEATALADINPVLITLGAAIFLGEPLGLRRLGGVVAALCGALIILRPGSDVFTPAALLPLCSAILYTINALLTRRLGQHESAWTPMLHAALFGTIVLGMAQPFIWEPIAAADWPFVALIGGLGSLGQLCLIRAFSMAEAGVVAPFAYAGILFATLWSVLFFGQWPDLQTLLGALVIVGAGLYVWAHETREAARR